MTVIATAVGPVACATVVWRFRGALRVTVAVKATFALVDGGPATLAAPVDLVRHDVSFDRDPAMSLERAADLVPMRPRADVTFVGHAHAPNGRAVQTMAVRLGVAGEKSLVDKTLHVFGARVAGRAGAAPFTQMALRYERGPGVAPGTPLPNVVHAIDPARPAGFGPERGAQGVEGDIVEIADDFDWSSFQAAPTDQRPPYLRGDEFVILDGLHPSLARLSTRLPSARGVARASVAGRVSAVQLVADTLAIDGDARVMSVVWRGAFGCDAAALASTHVYGAVEIGGRGTQWPDIGPIAAPTRAPAHLASTAELDDRQQAQSAERAAIPFVPASSQSSQSSFAAPAGPENKAPARFSGTVALGADAHPSAASANPFSMGATPPSPFAPPPPAAEVRSTPAPAEGAPLRKTPAVPIFHTTPFTIVVFPWQLAAGKESLVVFAKGTFDIVPNAPARARPEADPPHGDELRGPDASLAHATDFAVFKPRADVLISGFAYGGGKSVAMVTFAFGHEGNRFERRIAAFGDRRWRSSLGGATPSPPEPFERIPLVYERAFGGPRCEANPVGVGHAAVTGDALPNLEDPQHLVTTLRDEPAAACGAPIRADWRARTARLGSYDAAWLASRWPYFPADFDFGYFQAAPPTQQLRWLAGDEPFAITGMRPVDHGHAPEPAQDGPPQAGPLRGSLAGLRLRCVVEKAPAVGGALHEVALRLDTVAIDVEAMKLDVVWRAAIDVVDDDASDLAAMFFTHEPMTSRALSLEEIRAACLLKKRLVPVDVPPARPANDAPKAPDPDLAKVLAEAAARTKEAEAKLAAVGVAIPDPRSGAGSSTMPKQDAQALAERLRAAKVDDGEIAKVTKLIDATNAAADAPDPRAPTPSEVRARVIEMLATGASFERADLRGADLSELDFSGRSMAGARLSRARLVACVFAGADLTHAALSDANLEDAKLVGANLSDADLHASRVARADFEGTTLDRASFAKAGGDGASFVDAKGARASFADAELRGARFDRAVLDRADFSRSKLDDARFVGATLYKVRLFDAQGARVSFERARMIEACADASTFVDSTFQGADLTRSSWEGASLDRSRFSAARLPMASLVRASCVDADFSLCEMKEARGSRAKLTRAILVGANLMQARFDHADLSNADLRSANLYAAETWKAILHGARLERAITARSKVRAPRAESS